MMRRCHRTCRCVPPRADLIISSYTHFSPIDVYKVHVIAILIDSDSGAALPYRCVEFVATLKAFAQPACPRNTLYPLPTTYFTNSISISRRSTSRRRVTIALLYTGHCGAQTMSANKFNKFIHCRIVSVSSSSNAAPTRQWRTRQSCAPVK